MARTLLVATTLLLAGLAVPTASASGSFCDEFVWPSGGEPPLWYSYCDIPTPAWHIAEDYLDAASEDFGCVRDHHVLDDSPGDLITCLGA